MTSAISPLLWKNSNDSTAENFEKKDQRSSSFNEEFDFADVFGQVHSGEHSLEAASIPNLAADSLDHLSHSLETWAPLSVISGGKPLVINHRSHSLVGPAYGQPGSLGCLTDLLDKLEAERGNVHKQPLSEGRTLSDREVSVTRVVDQNEENDLIRSGDSSGDEGRVIPLCGHVGDGKKLIPQDFELLRLVGQGAFGKVFQVQKKDTGEILAMKVMRKDRIKERNHGDYMKAERDILTKAIHPFIVQLQYSFQTSTKLYLLLEFINGGHLFFQLYRHGIFSEELAKIYTAEIVLAVAHLHKMGIMHRDLKPENILLDSDGHVKLTDFGLAKEVSDTDKSNSLCGTTEYMAPEIITAKGHGRSADWWSVGVLLYEMLTGQPPFLNKNKQKLQQKIVKDKVKFPPFLTAEATSLLKQLLQKDPEKRIGSGPSGSDDIKYHKWFKSIHWGKLEQREIQPKFKPTVNGKQCTANFDEIWTDMPVQDSPVGTPSAEDEFYLGGYSFAAPRQYLPTVDSDSQGEGSESDSEDEPSAD